KDCVLFFSSRRRHTRWPGDWSSDVCSSDPLAEIAPSLLGGRVQKVYQPHAEAISLEIRSQGKTLTLYFSADPETARLHLLSKKPLNPSAPPPFCQLLRAHLEGARIERIEQVGNDRIVRLVMQRDGKPVTLVAELTG